MDERNAILFANEAFYRAFADRDGAAMEDAWSRDQRITCIHPGWPPLTGRDEVMQSWLGILGNSEAPDIKPT